MMQRVSALLPSWDRSKANASNLGTQNKNDNKRANRSSTNLLKPRPTALSKVLGWAADCSTNRRSTGSTMTSPRFGHETYWPSSLETECDKAARILKSFCSDGFLATESSESRPTSASPNTIYVTRKIPPRIIQDAVGLAIFSCMRSGLWMSGSGGSGILIARKADGTWSPPSGILLHTAALGFVIGVDIYDCVLVINDVASLEMFTRPRLILGTDVNLSMGPLVNRDSLAHDVRWKELNSTVLTYLKARGKHQHVPLDGSLVTERANENERFYDSQVKVLDKLAGAFSKEIPETRPLLEVIKASEGRTDYDRMLVEFLSQQPAPGDAVIDTSMNLPMMPLSPPLQSAFGIPDKADPDPFGVIALEMAGLEIREAGSRIRPASTQFEFNPSPSSPAYSKVSRQSIDTFLTRSNRGSYMSFRTQATAMTDAQTQTDLGCNMSEPSNDRADGDESRDPHNSLNILDKLQPVAEPEKMYGNEAGRDAENRLLRRAAARSERVESVTTTDGASEVKPGMLKDVPAEMKYGAQDDRDDDADDEEDENEEEEPFVYEIAMTAQPTGTAIVASQATQVIHAKGALVTIPKRVPPPLPARSLARTSRASKRDYGDGDVSVLGGLLRTSFQSFDSSLSTGEHSGAPDAPEKTSHVEASASAVLSARRSRLSLSSASETRWSQHSASMVSPNFALELTSSAEDSDREPKTPKVDDDFEISAIHVRKPEVMGTADMTMEAHRAHRSIAIV